MRNAAVKFQRTFSCHPYAIRLSNLIGNGHRAVRTSLLVIASVLIFSTVISESAPLNDTGITTFGDATSNNLPAEPVSYPGQDASFGRDAAAQAGTLTKIGGGRAGFDFTKIDANGNALPASATSWSCVQDNVTGLVWEVKSDDGGLRDKDNTYTWYNPDPNTNGGIAGTQNGGTCTGSACDTYSFVQTINSQGLCGFNDWRLPWPEELRSIVDQSLPYGSAVDVAYFRNTSQTNLWSAASYAGIHDYAFYISLYDGWRSATFKFFKYPVCLVRGGQ